ncbi:hypothetical protein NJC40_17535 [Pseudomonas sp. 21LCFQ02]|uniref:hypothetical protein n=1 Tax=unclassified Pseudomonas TaxID=196821 RepID=UPI0004F5F36D|nr:MULTISPECIES: hypothetical protein [unclassified Pseudomonas]MCO8165052.1 hypothetical protein [Pseudomonas sp. 21LCFQ010]MCO8169571.1 hypothetical protein [Pseudomonas sp. 21LCFQ02]BAP46236.1 glucose dehydrogenase [Pseudomonas sp. StFLB209]
MSTQGALSRARLLPTFFGAGLLVLGLVKFSAGLKLVSLGGSYYYVLSGLGFALCGLSLMLVVHMAVWLFTLCLSLGTVGALWEVGLDRQQLLPRLLIWFLIGLLLLLPVIRRSLKPTGRPFSLGHLIVALLLAGISLDPLAQIRQFGPDYRQWAESLIPSLAVMPLALEDGGAKDLRQPES